MQVVIETKRLILRQFTEADADLIYQLNFDPDVTKYTLDPFRDIEHAREVLEQVILPQYAVYNHGRWAVHLKPGMEFIGWCGLKFVAERKEIDLGYRFFKKNWGKGYATEAAYACIKFGFEKLDLREIIARVMPGNLGSIKVLENCGMEYVGDEDVDEHMSMKYRIINPLSQ